MGLRVVRPRPGSVILFVKTSAITVSFQGNGQDVLLSKCRSRLTSIIYDARRSGQVSGAECDTAMNVCLVERLVNVMFLKSVAAHAELVLVLCLNSSWTEDTRSCIFSDTALKPGKDGQKPRAAELDVQIEQKFEEFEELVTKGKNLLDKDHHLTQMVSRVLLYIYDGFLFLFSNFSQVKERMEELRSMLGWITVHWRAQKQQWLHKKNREEASQDNIYSTMCPVTEVTAGCRSNIFMLDQSPQSKQ